MSERRLVVVPYYYPPFPGSGNRWPAMARYLRRAGHSVTVVATDAFGRLSEPEEEGIIRVGDLRSARLLRWLLRRGEQGLAGSAAIEVPPTALLTKTLVPDAQVLTWLPGAVLAVRRLVARKKIDCLVTSGPPDSTHLIGLLLRPHRVAWVADFRDGWRYEPLREPFPTGLQRGLDSWLERRVARMADVTVGATRPIADDLERRLRARAAYVPSGWDPDAASEPSTLARDHVAGVVTLAYTGTFSGVRGSDPEPLLRALAKVNADGSLPPLRLVLAGRLTAEERNLIDRSGVADAVEHLGIVDRAGALALQRSADALVLITSRDVSVATGKIFEYLGAGRPIVALAQNNEAARIIGETNTGVCVPPDDVDAIIAALRRVVSGDLERAYTPRNLERYTYPGPADTMASVIEEAVRRSANR